MEVAYCDISGDTRVFAASPLCRFSKGRDPFVTTFSKPFPPSGLRFLKTFPPFGGKIFKTFPPFRLTVR
jgi:hypothetical protein